jgi:class 3 adenylate cyclase
MSNQRITTKKLKAIVFADVVNFTDISSIDEQKALDLIDKLNTIAKPITVKYNGEWLKELGDGFLISFDSSLEAVRCSIEIQKSIVDIDDLKIRIGIHQGDIFIKDGDIFGDDVNIASRIEGFSPEGGISLSDKVYKDISSVKDIKTAFIGHRKLKGVQQETKIRCITSHNLPEHKRSQLPIVAAYLCFGLAIINFMAAISYSYLFYTEGFTFNLQELSFIEVQQRTLIMGITYLVLGYSCLSFYKGLSLKSQRLLLYLSYLFILLPFIRGILLRLNMRYSNLLGELMNDINHPLAFQYVLGMGFVFTVVIPTMIILLFRKYYNRKK